MAKSKRAGRHLRERPRTTRRLIVLLAVAVMAVLAVSQIASANDTLDGVDFLDCDPNQTYPIAGDADAAAALEAAGYSCTGLFNKPTVDSDDPTQVGELWHRLDGTILRFRVIFFSGGNTGFSDSKICLDDDNDPINDIVPGGADAPTCIGKEAQFSASQGGDGGPSYPPAKAADVAPEESAGNLELKIENLTEISEIFGGTTVGGWNINIDGYTEVLPHFNLGGFSIVAYFQPIIPVPEARISIEADATNEVGDPHTFTVTVEADPDINSGGGFAPVQGADVDFTLTDSNGANSVLDAANSTCDDPGGNTDANGQCTIVFTSNSAGQVTGNASVTVFDLFRDTAGDSGPGGSGPAVKTFVDAFITIDPDDTNPIGDPHTFTVTVKQDLGDGNGFVDAPDNTVVSVSLTPAGGAAVLGVTDFCAAPGTTNGTCTVTFHSDTAGTITGHAEVTFNVGGVSLTRATDGIAPNSNDAVKTYVSGAIRINKDSTKGGAVTTAGAVFSITGDLSPGSVTDNGANDSDPAIGRICVVDLKPGATYTVNETTPPPGYGAASEANLTVDAVEGDCDTTALNTETFVNPPLFDIQVNWRDGDAGQLDIESIDCVTATGTSDTTAATGWEASETTTDIEFVDNDIADDGLMKIECTIVVDP